MNRAHAQVFSTPESPVAYNAFDPDLQLWIAACLYRGVEDVYRLFVGDIDEHTADQLYSDSMALGTTLQVPPEMWPPNRRAFEEYWQNLMLVDVDWRIRTGRPLV